MKTTPQELELQKKIDLGLILDTTMPLQLSIPIKNTSDRTITIEKVSRDCACMSVTLDKRKLGPGEVATLRVVANLTGKLKWYVGEIIVESDAAEKIDEILIHGEITGQVRIRPSRATILTGDQRVPGRFSIFCDDQDGKWKCAGVAPEDPGLAVHLNPALTTSTTSTYDGTVDITTDEARKKYADYQESLITFTFVNDSLGRTLEIKYPVEVAIRRTISVDPPQVTFLAAGAEQRRTVVVQSAQGLELDAARCDYPGIQTAIHRIDARALTVDLVFQPALAGGSLPGNVSCALLSGGKTIGAFPINLIEIR